MALTLQTKSVQLKTKSIEFKVGRRNIQSLGNMTPKQQRQTFFKIKRSAMLPKLKEYGLFGVEKGVGSSVAGVSTGVKTAYAVGLATMGSTPNSKAGIGAGTTGSPTYDENREAASHIDRTKISAKNVIKGGDVLYRGGDNVTLKIGRHNLKKTLLEKGVSKETASFIAKSKAPMTVSEITNLGIDLNTAKEVAEYLNPKNIPMQTLSPARRQVFASGVKRKTGAYVKYRAKHTAAGQAVKKYAARMRASSFGRGMSSVWNNDIIRGVRTFIRKAFAIPFKIIKALGDAIAIISGAILPVVFLIFFVMIMIAIIDDDEQQKKATLEPVSYTNLSDAVMQYKGALSEACSRHGISEYLPYLLAIMQVESGGEGNDVMKCSESKGLPPNTLSVGESIDQGAAYFSALLKQGASQGVTDLDAVIQAYNFGPGYFFFLSQNGWLHSYSLAKQYSLEMSGSDTKYEYKNEVSQRHGDEFIYGYGNFHYVDLVKQYLSFQKQSGVGGGIRDENGIPEVPLIKQGYGGGYWNPETQQFEHTDWPYQDFWDSDLANAGCSVTSAAMALSYITGELYNPVEMGLSTLPDDDFLGYLTPVKEYNIEYKFGITWDEAVSALKEGHLVIAKVNRTICPGLGAYAENGTDKWPISSAHFILLIGITPDGSIAVQDPGSKSDLSYWYMNKKKPIPQNLIAPAFESASTIIYLPDGIGGIANPYGENRFSITDVALVWRNCPFHGLELHSGWDFDSGGYGTPIYAVTPGTVVTAGAYQGYGNHVVIIKSGDIYVLYGHMSSMEVEVGDTVKAGDRIGAQGSEGLSDAPHLHLEFRKGSIEGDVTAYKEAVIPMLNKYADNVDSYSDVFDNIEA